MYSISYQYLQSQMNWYENCLKNSLYLCKYGYIPMIRNSKCAMILKYQFRYHSDSEWVDYFHVYSFQLIQYSHFQRLYGIKAIKSNFGHFNYTMIGISYILSIYRFQMPRRFIPFHSSPFHFIQYKYRNRVLCWLIEMNINQNTANDSSFRLESVHFLLLSCFIHQSLIF